MTAKTQTAADLSKLLIDAKGAAAKDPRLAEVQSLTEAIVAGKRSKDRSGVPELEAKRDELKEAIFAPVVALSAKRAAAVKAERHAAATVIADGLAGKSHEDLTALLHGVTEERKRLRLQKRALRIVLDGRARAAHAKELVAQMSPEEKADLLRELEAG